MEGVELETVVVLGVLEMTFLSKSSWGCFLLAYIDLFHYFKKFFSVRITIIYSSSSLSMDIQAVNLGDYK